MVETRFADTSLFSFPHSQTLRAVAAIFAGALVGAVSSMLGNAGDELIIPILIFVFEADIRTAGTASVLVSIAVVVTGVVRHIFDRSFPVTLYARLSRAANECGVGARSNRWRRPCSLVSHDAPSNDFRSHPCRLCGQATSRQTETPTRDFSNSSGCWRLYRRPCLRMPP